MSLGLSPHTCMSNIFQLNTHVFASSSITDRYALWEIHLYINYLDNFTYSVWCSYLRKTLQGVMIAIVSTVFIMIYNVFYYIFIYNKVYILYLLIIIIEIINHLPFIISKKNENIERILEAFAYGWRRLYCEVKKVL